MYTIIDTEYTTWKGALESGWSLPNQHREVVQLSAINVDANFNEVAHLDLLVKPKLNPILSSLFLKLTGLEQTLVDKEGINFIEALKKFQSFSENNYVICMNADEAVFRENCKIHQIAFPFTHSWHRLRPFLEQCGVDLTHLSSGDLHTLTKNPLIGHTHNALHDVRSMKVWLQEAFSEKIFKNISELPTDLPTVDPRSKNKKAARI